MDLPGSPGVKTLHRGNVWKGPEPSREMLLTGPQDKGQQRFPLFQGCLHLPFHPSKTRTQTSTPCGIECQSTFWPLISKSLSGPFALAHFKKTPAGSQRARRGLRKQCCCSQLEAEAPWRPDSILDQALHHMVCTPANLTVRMS